MSLFNIAGGFLFFAFLAIMIAMWVLWSQESTKSTTDAYFITAVVFTVLFGLSLMGGIGNLMGMEKRKIHNHMEYLVEKNTHHHKHR